MPGKIKGGTSIFSPTIGRLATAWFVWCFFFPPCCGMPPWCTPPVLCYYRVLVTPWSCVLSYPAPSIPVFAPRSLIPARLHLHCTPRSLIFDYCTSPWVSLQFLFCFPAQRRSLFFPATHYRFELAPAVTGAPPISGPAYLSVPVCNRKHKNEFVTSSQHFFLNPNEGSVPWTEPTSGLSPQKGFPRACRTLTYTRTDRLC